LIIEEIKTIGVVGAGIMGHGIAQTFALKGFKVNLFDNDSKVLEDVPVRIRRNLQTLLELHLIESSEVESCLSHLHFCRSLSETGDGAELIIEAVSENLDLKRAVFSELERFTTPQTILCSNTSGIRIEKISEGLRFKERVVGTHFWNPPHLLPCVEVIHSPYTAPEVFHTVIGLLKKVGKEPVPVLKDIPGFLGNRLQHALWREAISLVEKGIASAEDIDRVVKYGLGLRLAFLGPLETADLAGLDLVYEVHKYLFPELENSPTASAHLKALVDQKATGVKAGRGFYRWTDEQVKEMIHDRDMALLKIIQAIRDIQRDSVKSSKRFF
jgi:3-hydroxybutyryl-CoA dehydrogenase